MSKFDYTHLTEFKKLIPLILTEEERYHQIVNNMIKLSCKRIKFKYDKDMDYNLLVVKMKLYLLIKEI